MDRLETAADDLAVIYERLGSIIDAGYDPVIDDGVKTLILPAENEQDVRYLPDYMQDKVGLVFVRDIQEALDVVLMIE